VDMNRTRLYNTKRELSSTLVCYRASCSTGFVERHTLYAAVCMRVLFQTHMSAIETYGAVGDGTSLTVA